MRIKKVRLKNGYKRFHDLTIDLGEQPARLVALVGPNGCGKSSVLDGMLYHVHAHGRLGSGPNRDGSYHSMRSSSVVTYEDIIIEFETGNYSTVRQSRESTGMAGTIFSFRSPYRYNNTLKIQSTQSTPDIKLNNYGAGDASSIDAKMEDNYRRLHGAYNRYLEANDAKPSEAKNHIIGELNKSIKNCLDVEIANLGNVESARGTLYFKKVGHPEDFEFNVLSSGEKEVVDLILDLYLRKEDYNDTIFLIDEPELHINTAIQKKLLIEIDRLVGDNCQIWITTHSIGFLKAIQSEMSGKCQIIHFTPDVDRASQADILKPVTPSPAVWRSLFSVALDELVDMVSPETIIYCEGRADPTTSGSERGMDAQAFNNIFGSENPQALFVSSGGGTELDQRSSIAISILGKVFPSVKILVLKDRDMASGKITDQNDRSVYLATNDDNHRVLNRWEIENYLYDKSVLQNYCALNSLAFDEDAYDSFVTDIANQNLKDHTGRIKNICGIKSNINPEKFKLALSKCLTVDMDAFAELKSSIFY